MSLTETKRSPLVLGTVVWMLILRRWELQFHTSVSTVTEQPSTRLAGTGVGHLQQTLGDRMRVPPYCQLWYLPRQEVLTAWASYAEVAARATTPDNSDPNFAGRVNAPCVCVWEREKSTCSRQRMYGSTQPVYKGKPTGGIGYQNIISIIMCA